MALDKPYFLTINVGPNKKCSGRNRVPMAFACKKASMEQEKVSFFVLLRITSYSTCPTINMRRILLIYLHKGIQECDEIRIFLIDDAENHAVYTKEVQLTLCFKIQLCSNCAILLSAKLFKVISIVFCSP